MKKKIGLLILSVALISLLTACSEKKDATSSTPESESTNGKEMTFSQYFARSKKEAQIWYRVRANDDGISKDTEISSAYVFDNNKVTKYAYIEMSLGDASKMSDKEILKEIKKQQNAYDQNIIDENIKRVEETIHDRENSTSGADQIALFDEQLKYLRDSKVYTPEPSKFKFSIQTDGTDNNAASEKISFDYKKQELAYLRMDEADGTDTVEKTQLVDQGDEIAFSGPSVLRGTTIYDAKYITVNVDEDYFMLCRDDKIPPLVFDEPDAKNVAVDPKK